MSRPWGTAAAARAPSPRLRQPKAAGGIVLMQRSGNPSTTWREKDRYRRVPLTLPLPETELKDPRTSSDGLCQTFTWISTRCRMYASGWERAMRMALATRP